ncbi:hypothetical protein MADE_000001021520 [Alteromonas mediterranea DE]|uniref:Uncharacterized protein n=1 Tax=Alteromonas mediterranea (strain DSM 17117 / CIP 110805 / LMG 28347 / Deep ecotype) TaxID=1774373 RepID=T2DMT0_ALTMD|nr:hypothetical protein MADE_000001021520 [Alteromonas mediterranea DE]
MNCKMLTNWSVCFVISNCLFWLAFYVLFTWVEMFGECLSPILVPKQKNALN